MAIGMGTRTDVFVGGLPRELGQDAIESALTSIGIAPLEVAWQQENAFGVAQLDSERTALSACQLLRQVQGSRCAFCLPQ